MSIIRQSNGRFAEGSHWREPQPFRDMVWLQDAYVTQQRSTGDIARQFGVTDAAVMFWLRRHGIPRRSISAARQVKKWAAAGPANPMYGKTGALNGNWKGGVTPERQRFYSSSEWRSVERAVRARDQDQCQRCGNQQSGHRALAIHHIVPFEVEAYRSDPTNLISLCASCHKAVHARKGGAS